MLTDGRQYIKLHHKNGNTITLLADCEHDTMTQKTNSVVTYCGYIQP